MEELRLVAVGSDRAKVLGAPWLSAFPSSSRHCYLPEPIPCVCAELMSEKRSGKDGGWEDAMVAGADKMHKQWDDGIKWMGTG